jgi:hypothetical protein
MALFAGPGADVKAKWAATDNPCNCKEARALSLLRDLHLARHSFSGDIVLRQVEDALNKPARAKSAF